MLEEINLNVVNSMAIPAKPVINTIINGVKALKVIFDTLKLYQSKKKSFAIHILVLRSSVFISIL